METKQNKEDYSWEIKFDEECKPFYYNSFSGRVLFRRPNCLESGGRVNISQPVIEAQYNGLWYKGILLGPSDTLRFSVQLEQGPLQILDVSRDGIRRWTIMRRHTFSSSAKRGSLDSFITTSESKGPLQIVDNCRDGVRRWTIVRRHTFPSSAKRGSIDSFINASESKEAFLESGDDQSLSVLSDTFSRSTGEEKCDFESNVEKDRQFEQTDKVSMIKMMFGLKTRSKSCGNLTKQELVQNDWSDEDGETDWMNTMLPLQTRRKSKRKGRRQRINAVLLDVEDLITIQSTSSKSIPYAN